MRLTLLLLAFFSAFPAAAADLPRKASLGLRLAPAPQGNAGVLVEEVISGQTGAALGVRKGDIVHAAGGRPVASVPEVIAYAATLAGGDRVDLRVHRGGEDLAIAGKALPRPREQWSGASVDYGAVAFRGGHLRDILVTPAGVKDPPVLFLIQGFSCATMESGDPSHPYRRLGEEMIARGIAYYRVEKPNMGDSRDGPDCAAIDFAAEMEAFRSAYRHLTGTRGVSPDRIFMFGHSLGGIQAPLLAAEQAPRGVAAYGTVLRNWADYHRNVDTFQSYLFSGADPVEAAAGAERNRDMFRLYYFERKDPRSIAAARPDLAAALRETLGWDGGERMLGRHWKFMQDLAHLPLMAAWRDTKSNVLSLYGESDVVAVFGTDHELLADIVNWYRPGTARYAMIPGTDHGMTLVGDRQELRRKTIAAGQPPEGDFNPAIAEAVAVWIRESMARPPVRTLPERKAG